MAARPGAVHALASVAVVIPWRAGCPFREAALAWCAAQWPWPVVLGEVSPTSDWVKADAVRTGVDKTSAEILVIADCDVWCPTVPIVEALDADGAEWGHPHRGIRRLTAEATADVLIGGLNVHAVAGTHLIEPPTRAHPGGGIVVIRRDTYERIPLDPRFAGWGHEDDAWGWALQTLAGQPARGDERLIHLWHPPQPRRSRQRGSEASFALQERYWSARSQPTPMRELIGEFHANQPR